MCFGLCLPRSRFLPSLRAASLMHWEQVFLYQSAQEAQAARQATPQAIRSVLLASPLIFDGRLWEAEMQGTTVILRPEAGTALTLTTDQFQRLVEMGQIKQGEQATPSPLQETARQRLTQAGPKALEAANRRWREILAYL